MENKWFFIHMTWYNPYPNSIIVVSEPFFGADKEVGEQARMLMDGKSVSDIQIFELTPEGKKINRKELFR